MTDKIVILSTCSSPEEAEKIARLLVEQHLAACVNVLPRMHSVYRWNGAVESAEEALLVIKSSRELFPSLRRILEQANSYEVAEAIALPILDGAETYMNWLEANLRKTDGDGG
jgi:periplasmic divalent cation tolerance protein